MKKYFWMASLAALLFLNLGFGFSQEGRPKMVQDIVKLKYIKHDEILSVLYTFLSRDGRINANSNSELLTISDFPENVAKILSVIREYDVKPVDFQFTVQLVVGSQLGEERTDEVLRDDVIIKELRTLLRYKSFSLVDTSFVRAIDKQYSEVTMGKNAELNLLLRPKYIKEDKEEVIQLETSLRKIVPASGKSGTFETTLLHSNFSVRSGEKTVVGVSKMDGGENALILIISGKVIR